MRVSLFFSITNDRDVAKAILIFSKRAPGNAPMLFPFLPHNGASEVSPLRKGGGKSFSHAGGGGTTSFGVVFTW